MIRWVEFYDHNGLQILDSLGASVPDQNLTTDNMVSRAFQKIQNQAQVYLENPVGNLKPRECYIKVVQAPSLESNSVHVIRDTMHLENPCW